MSLETPSSSAPRAEAPPEEVRPGRPGGGRLLSLDAFRGLTVAGMLLVNNIALDSRTPVQLSHAPWNGGVRFADLIFPWFLLTVGTALPFSAASARRSAGGWRYAGRVLGRVLSLVFLGCWIDSSLLKQPVFDLNVLQLIGLAYGVGALLYGLPVWLRLPVAGALLAAHTAVIHDWPPGQGRGVFREDANAILYLNRAYLHRWHLDGLGSVVPTAALVLIGTVYGDTLRRDTGKPGTKLAVLLAFSGVLAAAGWAWHFSLPYSKTVWTASYILLTAGLGGVVLTTLYAFVDMAGWKWLVFPLIVYGSNAIAAYVGPILIKLYILRVWTWKMPDGTRETLERAWLHLAIIHYGPYRGGWIYTLGYLLAVWLALWELRRRKLFLRV